jgi:NADPH:quinone reductase-like Zn-dependent oxidoreductase
MRRWTTRPAGSENKADLIALTEMIESGQVTPVIDKIYPLSETIAAIRYMRDGHAPRGKVVIRSMAYGAVAALRWPSPRADGAARG